MTSQAKTIAEYLAGLPEDRRRALGAVRQVILKNLPPGFEEGMQYGMIGYYVPHSRFPAGYHCDPAQPLPFAALGSQKNHMALYLMCVYGSETTRRWFEDAYRASGKRLDMGKACVRFKRLEDLPLEVIGQVIARVPLDQYVAGCQAALEEAKGKKQERKQRLSAEQQAQPQPRSKARALAR